MELISATNANPGAQSVQQLDVVNPGLGYTEPPKVKFKKTSGRTGTGASLLHLFLEMVLWVSLVLQIWWWRIYNSTRDYIQYETFLSGVTTVSAAATAIVSAAGTITEIRFMDAGAGYSATPTLTIGNPHFGSTGEFIFNETITGSTSEQRQEFVSGHVLPMSLRLVLLMEILWLEKQLLVQHLEHRMF